MRNAIEENHLKAFWTDESQIKTLRNMNTVLTYVIMCLVCRFKAPGGGFRNLKFDLLYKCTYIHKACGFTSV